MSALPPPIHVILRYRDPEPGIRTIERHRELVVAHGAVWFGKVGKTLAERWAEAIRAQVAAGTSTYLYLATRRHGELVVHRGSVVRITRSRPADDHLIPEYYRQLALEQDISFWTLLQSLEEIPQEELRDMVVASSGRPVLESLRSSASILIVMVE